MLEMESIKQVYLPKGALEILYASTKKKCKQAVEAINYSLNTVENLSKVPRIPKIS